MSTIVTSPISPKRAEWQPGHIPRLSYRNPIPADESLPELNTTKTSKRANVPALSIREIREALPREANIPVSSPTTSQSQKGKKSFLGSIFVKEPSMAALDQVAQQMMQQHNAASPKSIPYVSQQKMPRHVPKVNSKWDGVPEYVKSREKQEKDRTKAARRISLLPTTSRSRSGEIEQHAPRMRRNSNDGSVADSWDSRSTDSRPVFQDVVSMRPASIYSASSSGSITVSSQPFSEQSKSSASFSGTKTSDLSFPYPNETHSLLNGLQSLTSAQSTSTRGTMSTENIRSERPSRSRMSTTDTVPEYTSSPGSTPLESSPRTPAFFPNDDIHSDVQVLMGKPLSLMQLPTSSSAGGGAKADKQFVRSDVQAGSGIYSNIAIRTNSTPWEIHDRLTEEVKRLPSLHSKGRVSGRGKR